MDEMRRHLENGLEVFGSKLGWTLGNGESGFPGQGVLDEEALGLGLRGLVGG